MLSLIKKLIPKNVINLCWHLPKAVFANIVYGFPARRIKVIAIAGTKGKTTTTYLTAQLLEALGERVALSSTALVKIGAEERLNDLKMTTPGVFYLQKFLRQAVRAGCTYAVLEVSSHAIKQFRVWGVPFEVVALTNLSPDHLEYHQNAQDYQFTHWRLLGPRTKKLVFNVEDPDLQTFKQSSLPQTTLGTQAGRTIVIQNMRTEGVWSTADVKVHDRLFHLQEPLPGDFNIWNTVTALGVVVALEKNIETAILAAKNLKGAPGRMEVLSLEAPFSVIVDYAHSPESLQKFFIAIRPSVKGRLIVVMGACGERDPVQRPIMGRLLGEQADAVIVTNDDPYGEDPMQIADQLIAGVKQVIGFEEGKNWWRVLDRRQAIKQALSLAQAGDVVAVLGKGAEQWQVFANKKIPWDDRRIVREVFQEIHVEKKADTP